MGLLEGVRREECRSLGLERRRRAFCQTKGSSREQGVLAVWQAAVQGHEVWVWTCLQHSLVSQILLLQEVFITFFERWWVPV